MVPSSYSGSSGPHQRHSSAESSKHPLEQKYDDRWEKWELEDPDRHSTDSSQHSTEGKYNDRWDEWQRENTDGYLSPPENDKSHHPFRNSTPSNHTTASSQHSSENEYNSLWEKWELGDPVSQQERVESCNLFRHSTLTAPSSSEQKNNHHWRHCETEDGNRDSSPSQLTGDQDYIPSKNFRPTPGPSNNRSISRENSTTDENNKTHRIGLWPYDFFCFCTLFNFDTVQHLIF
jgi:hypothetical protein